MTPLKEKRLAPREVLRVMDAAHVIHERQAALQSHETFDRDAAIRDIQIMYEELGDLVDRHVIERALALNPGRDRIEAEDLPEEVRAGGAGADAAPELPDAGMDLPAHLQRVEASLIRTALDRTGGNKQQAARLLNIKRTTLVEKAKRIDH